MPRVTAKDKQGKKKKTGLNKLGKKISKFAKETYEEGKKDAEYLKSGKAKKKVYLGLSLRKERIASEGVSTPKTKAQIAKNKKIVAARKKKAKPKAK
jgi:hypothetical protein